MNLLLLSKTQEESKDFERLFWETTGKSPGRIGYIPSKSDPAGKYYHRVCEYYRSLTRETLVLCDVDQDFNEKNVDRLLACDTILLSGGVTAHFLGLLQKRGLLPKLAEFARNGGTLVGESAGAIIMGHEIGIILDSAAEREAGALLESTEGLGLYDFEFYPHFRPSFELVQRLEERARKTKRRILACPDGAGIMVNGNRIHHGGKASTIWP